jgi:hypothetical protein
MVGEGIRPMLAWLNADTTCKQIERETNAQWDNLIVAGEKRKTMQG